NASRPAKGRPSKAPIRPPPAPPSTSLKPRSKNSKILMPTAMKRRRRRLKTGQEFQSPTQFSDSLLNVALIRFVERRIVDRRRVTAAAGASENLQPSEEVVLSADFSRLRSDSKPCRLKSALWNAPPRGL